MLYVRMFVLFVLYCLSHLVRHCLFLFHLVLSVVFVCLVWVRVVCNNSEHHVQSKCSDNVGNNVKNRPLL